MNYIDDYNPILFIPGVLINECDNNNFNIQTNEFEYELSEFSNESVELDIDVPNSIEYDEIPAYYIDKKSWISSTNVICCYCSGAITNPIPIPINQTKILKYENNEIFMILDKTLLKKERTFNDKLDEYLIASSKIAKEIKAYKIHKVLCCDICCAASYIRNVKDNEIYNKEESIMLLLKIYTDLTDIVIYNIPNKDLWINMEQYSGKSGINRKKYDDFNKNKELKLKKSIVNMNYNNIL